jgi:transcriptional regulator with XRE-family HTH domain
MKSQHIGKRIKAFRLANQMTQVQVAVFLGVSRGTVVRLERGFGCLELTASKINQKLDQQERAA